MQAHTENRNDIHTRIITISKFPRCFFLGRQAKCAIREYQRICKDVKLNRKMMSRTVKRFLEDAQKSGARRSVFMRLI